MQRIHHWFRNTMVLLICIGLTMTILPVARPAYSRTEEFHIDTITKESGEELYPDLYEMAGSTHYKELLKRLSPDEWGRPQILSFPTFEDCRATFDYLCLIEDVDTDAFDTFLLLWDEEEQCDPRDIFAEYASEKTDGCILYRSSDGNPDNRDAWHDLRVVIRPDESLLSGLGLHNGLQRISNAYNRLYDETINKAGIHPGLSEKEAFIKIGTYICNHVSYDTEYMRSDWIDAMTYGKCVCHGYAQLVMVMCHIAGIPCDYLYGHVEGTEELHAWNRLRIDGHVYYVDVTWADKNRRAPSLHTALPGYHEEGCFHDLDMRFTAS